MKSVGTFGLFFVLAAASCVAQDVYGTISIQRRLTRQSVTAAVPMYQRGTAVQLGKRPDEGPIAFEESRVVVYLEGDIATGDAAASAAKGAQVQQLNRQFIPDIVVVPIGSSVSFPNMDPIFHDVYSLSKTRSFDLGAYDKGQTKRVTFAKPGIVDVYCHLHPNMAATVVVLANRFYARPDSDGHYRIADVPPGHYVLVAWHKSAGIFRKEIEVTAEKSTSADFLLPLLGDGTLDASAANSSVHTLGSR